MRLSPVLDYSSYWSAAKEVQEPLSFRFTGNLESVTDGETLWMHGEDLTIPVSLKNTVTYLLPAYKDESAYNNPNIDEEVPAKIRWGKVSTLTEGARVFVGGSLVNQEDRRQFVSTKKNPLIVIFYDGPDSSFETHVIQSCREQWEYWNVITPYSLIIGALCLILVAFTFLHRPVFRPTVIVSFVSLFIPLYPIIPPGLLFTVLCRRFAWKSRMFKAYSDLASMLGQKSLPSQTRLPSRPEDAAEPDTQEPPQKIAQRFLIKAYTFEVLTWLLLLAGIVLNIAFFLGIVFILL